MNERASQIFQTSYFSLLERTDRLFLRLFIVQWVLVTALSLWIDSTMEWPLAFACGAVLTLVPAAGMRLRPRSTWNRHSVAISQILFSSLFVQVTNGRLETHFHIFGSLAFLAFYRDTRVMMTATAIVAIDHFFGSYDFGLAQSLEHLGWIAFMNVFLIYSIRESVGEMRASAEKQEQLEKVMTEQTGELKKSQELLQLQSQVTTATAKSAALGEMAGQAAHEINTPLGALILITQALIDRIDKDPFDRAYFHQKLGLVLQITQKMGKIVNSMRKMAGRGANEVITDVEIKPMIEETILLCEGRFKRGSIIFNIEYPTFEFEKFECQGDEVSQILVNLLNNAHDAVKALTDLPKRWVKLTVITRNDQIQFRVEDGGGGISPENQAKLFQTSFTTKSLAEGTGFGLPICKKIAEKHHGRCFLDTKSANTCFVLELPRYQNDPMKNVVKVS